MLPSLTHISMIWRNSRRIWTVTCHPAKTPVRWMHHKCWLKMNHKWTRHVADKATVPYKPRSCHSEIIIWRFYALTFYFGIVMCLSVEMNLVYFYESNARARALTCSCCSFMFVLFLFCLSTWEKLQTKRSCWPVLLPFYPSNTECCQCLMIESLPKYDAISLSL